MTNDKWICTDPDCAQWQRHATKVSDGAYEMWQAVEGPEFDWSVACGMVFVDDLTKDDVNELCDTYGYDRGYLDDKPSLLAECVFEELAIELTQEDYSYRLKFPTFDTIDKAESFIKKQIGMEA